MKRKKRKRKWKRKRKKKRKKNTRKKTTGSSKRRRRKIRRTYNFYDSMVTRQSVEQCFAIDETDANDSLNVVINFNDLVRFLTESFVCRCCKSKIDTSSIKRKTVGIATTCEFQCCNKSCKHKNSIKPEVTHRKTEKEEENFLDNDYFPSKKRNPNYIGSYALNLRLVLLMQQFGLSEAATQQLLSALGLTTFANSFSRFSELEEHVGMFEVELTKMIIEENLLEEISKSEKKIINGKEMAALSTGMDGGWTNVTGKKRNSDNGHHVVVGNQTRKVIALKTMNRPCKKCFHGSHHHECICASNYMGSSKGMEAKGAVGNVLGIYHTGKAYVAEVVADDDSSTRSLLRHSHKDKKRKADELGESYELPRYDGGGLKPDHGMLPLHHPEPVFFADVNHRLRSKSKKEYAHAREPLYKSKCTKMDAARLKRNFSLCVHTYRRKRRRLDEFKTNVRSIIHHHFGDHSTCNIDWCPYLRSAHNPEKQKLLKYRCKHEDKELFLQLKELDAIFTTDEALEDLYHMYDTNKIESLNKFITKFLPKSTYLCGSMAAKSRVHTAVAIDSIGFEDFYSLLHYCLGIQYDGILLMQHKKLDKQRQYRYGYHQRQEVRRRKAKVISERVHKMVMNVLKDKKKGKTYESGTWRW